MSYFSTRRRGLGGVDIKDVNLFKPTTAPTTTTTTTAPKTTSTLTLSSGTVTGSGMAAPQTTTNQIAGQTPTTQTNTAAVTQTALTSNPTSAAIQQNYQQRQINEANAAAATQAAIDAAAAQAAATAAAAGYSGGVNPLTQNPTFSGGSLGTPCFGGTKTSPFVGITGDTGYCYPVGTPAATSAAKAAAAAPKAAKPVMPDSTLDPAARGSSNVFDDGSSSSSYLTAGMGSGVPTWVYVAAGAAALFFFMRR